jgi:hypothetical protein
MLKVENLTKVQTAPKSTNASQLLAEALPYLKKRTETKSINDSKES